jgi:branched-chain amino acid transport system permease protein
MLACSVLFAGNIYVRGLVILIALYTIAVTGLALLLGKAGQLSLAQGAFFGLGAYGYGVLTAKLGWASLPALAATQLGVFAVGYLCGIPLLRLSGHFLTLGTLSIALIFNVAMHELSPLTGGPSGLVNIARLGIGNWTLSSDIGYGLLSLGLAALSLYSFRNLSRSEFGLWLRAMRDSEVAASAMGLDVFRARLLVFALSAVYASLAGSMYAAFTTFISPAGFDVLLAIQLAVMALLGGAESYWGPALGAAGITLLGEVVRDLVPRVVQEARGQIEIVAFGVVLALMMATMPQGITGSLARWRKLTGG